MPHYSTHRCHQMSLREDNLDLFADSKSEVIFGGGGGILGWSDPNFLSYPGEVPIRGGAILKLLGNFKSELTKKPPPPQTSLSRLTLYTRRLPFPFFSPKLLTLSQSCYDKWYVWLNVLFWDWKITLHSSRHLFGNQEFCFVELHPKYRVQFL